MADILDAFSVISFTIDEQIAEGETVVTKYAERSVIRGEFAVLPRPGTEESRWSLLSLSGRKEGRG